VSPLPARLRRLHRPHIARPHVRLPRLPRFHIALPHVALPHVALPHFALPRIAWRRVVIRTAKIGTLTVALSVALGGAAFGAVTLYSAYGPVRNEPNTQAWRDLTPRAAGALVCTSCHASEATAQDASIHADVSCEDCHGPAAAHAGDEAAARATVLPVPKGGICASCHAAIAGRPSTFPQVDLAAHFSGGSCLRCHDPHSIVAVRPPAVTHPLANLPECTTCHAPGGLKKVPSGHEIVADAVCLACHGHAATRQP